MKPFDDINRRDFLVLGTGALTTLIVPRARAEILTQLGEDGPPINVGLVGCGRQGRVLLGELGKFPAVKVKAICDVVEGRLRSAKRRARDAVSYGDHRAMLDQEKDLQAILVATPTHLHREIVETCLVSDKHVYCEAPIASTIEDARAIAAAAKSSSTVFHSGLQWRCNPIYDLARTFMISGSIRDVVCLRGQWHEKTSWRLPASDPSREREVNWRLYKDTSIGLAGEVGTHQFDAMSWFMNKLPEAVSGNGSIMAYDDGREIHDTIHCQMRWPGNVMMSYEATLANSYGGRSEEFMGTMGAIRLIGDFGWLFKEADAPTQGWEVYAIRESFHKEEGITLIADATKLAKQGKLKRGIGLPHPPITYGLQAFLASAQGNKPSACPAPVGLRAAVLGIKAHEAVMTGREILFEEEWFKI